MSRLTLAFALLACVLTTLAAPAVAGPIDQAGWAERKRTVSLPNGIRLAYVELGNPERPTTVRMVASTNLVRRAAEARAIVRSCARDFGEARAPFD